MVTTTISLTTAEKSVYPEMALAKSSVGIGVPNTKGAQAPSDERFFCARVMVGYVVALRSAASFGAVRQLCMAHHPMIGVFRWWFKPLPKDTVMSIPTHIINAADAHARLSTQLDALLSLLIAPEAVNGLPADKLSALMWLAHDLLTQIESAHTTLQEAAA